MFNNANHALLFLVDTVFELYIIVVIARVLLQATHAPFHNPISKFVQRVTQTPVIILGRVIPRWHHMDVPAIAVALLLCFINIELDLLLSPLPMGLQPMLAIVWSILKLLVLVCDLYFFTILVQALLSWISSPGHYSPATVILWHLNEPLLRPVRKHLPPIAGLDLSPLVLLIGLQVVSLLLPLPGIFR